MSEYFSSFIVEPVVRQARRFSRLSTGEEYPSFLPTVPESLRVWYPGRLWNTSPPASISGEERQEHYNAPTSTFVGQWGTSIPSPPLEAMESGENNAANPEQDDGAGVAPFPPLEPQIAQLPRPTRLNEIRTHSDTSINPLRELPDRSRIHEEDVRGHSQSDPVARIREESGASSGSSSVEMARAYYENDGQTRSRDGSGTLPADDGMGPLRQKINAIWQGEGTMEKKSQMLHSLMMEQYNSSRGSLQGFSIPPRGVSTSSRPLTPSSLRDSDEVNPGSPMSLDLAADEIKLFNLSPGDMTATYAPSEAEEQTADQNETPAEVQAPQLGCMHYKRNVKLQCYTCKRWYTCRFCHDDAEDHVLPRQETENMLCMICNTPQSASQICKACGEQASCYYCPICKLWNNDPAKSIYHCEDCGICRLGEGLGKDFFHCKICAVCMSIGVQSTHRCIERSTKCDCPICGEYLFTSAGAVVFMRCGHSIHQSCFKEWCRASYKCPICSKSVVNMESQFRSLDRQIEAQPMPDEYRDTRAYIHCNDCFARGTTKYHWLGLKCERCESYNTQQHYLLEADGSGSRPRSDDGATAAPVSASPPLPQNVSDEAVAIPNSTAASRRPSISMSEAAGPSTSPWLLPQPRGARSVSPTVGNYFGTGLVRREEKTSSRTPEDRRDDHQEYDFWGRPLGSRSPSRGSNPDDEEDEWNDEEADDEEDDDDDDDEGMEEDGCFEDDDDDDGDNDDIDQMTLIGHR